MKVAATTWTYEGNNADTPEEHTEILTSEREFIDAGYSQYIWSSFLLGLNDGWDEDGILHIPEWLAKDNDFPLTSEDRFGGTDWCGYAAVNLNEDRETEKALHIDAMRADKSPILSGTNGLRRRRVNEFVPKSQVTLLTLEEHTVGNTLCWNCGTPMPTVKNSALDNCNIGFIHDGQEYWDILCCDCADEIDLTDDFDTNLEECIECEELHPSCKKYRASDVEGWEGWRCADHLYQQTRNMRNALSR